MRHICVVDDDDFYAEILCNLLKMQDYEVTRYDSSSTALNTLSDSKPEYDAILLDVMMPDMDGYQLCKHLRQIPAYEKKPILFISSKDSMDDKIKGFEAGGDDFLVKPIQTEELKLKLEHAIATNATNAELEKVAAQARAMMSQAISSAGELDLVAQFVATSLQCNTFNSLTQSLLHSCDLLGAQCSAFVYTEHEPFFDSVDGVRRTIEIELLEMAHKKGPVIEFNGRLIINQPNISLLIRRLPEEELKKERLKEQVQLLVQLASNRIASIEREINIKEQEVIFKEVLEAADKTVSDLVKQTDQQESAIHEVTEEFFMSLREDLLDLALDKDQETILLGMVKKNVSKITDMLMENKHSIESLHKPFQAFIEKLNKIM